MPCQDPEELLASDSKVPMPWISVPITPWIVQRGVCIELQNSYRFSPAVADVLQMIMPGAQVVGNPIANVRAMMADDEMEETMAKTVVGVNHAKNNLVDGCKGMMGGKGADTITEVPPGFFVFDPILVLQPSFAFQMPTRNPKTTMETPSQHRAPLSWIAAARTRSAVPPPPTKKILRAASWKPFMMNACANAIL